ncbi:MAG: HDOD domain-containing protein [Phycisphaerae bacterium]|nr:HDOD domain-containing protein [Phycisphaerae bacterium]
MNLLNHQHDQALARGGELRARRVEAVLQRVDDLPTLPAVATRLLSITSAREADLNEIIRLIESDPAQAARILKMCGAADKGLGARVGTVRRAVLMLGLDAVRAAVLSVQIFDLLERGGSEDESLAREVSAQDERASAFDRTGFWRHSIGVGCAAELVAGRFPGLGVTPDEAYMAGLLHGLGRLALDTVLPRAYGKVLALAERRREDSAYVERAVLGIDHHGAGRRLAEHWGLHASLRDSIWLHSRPAASIPDTAHRGLISAVTLANALARSLRLGWSGDFSPPPSLSSIARSWSIAGSTLDELTVPLFEEVAARVAALGLDLVTSPQLLTSAIVSANGELASMAAQLRGAAWEASKREASLHAVRDFVQSTTVGQSLTQLAEAIARSATRVLDADLLGVACLDGPDGSGRLARFHPRSGLPMGAVPIPAPDAGDAGADDALGRIARVASQLGDNAGPGRLRLESLTPPGAEPGTPAVALVWVAERADPPPPEVAALWSSALQSAWALESARRTNDTLAHTSRRLALSQERITEAESLARLGEFASGAAHELNNPLTTISLRCQELQEELRASPHAEALRAISEAGEQISELVTTLYVLSNPLPGLHSEFAPGEAVARAVELARARLGADPRVETELPEGLPRAEQDPELLAIAIAELVVNAREADGSCRVRITAQTDPVDDRLVFMVIDTGPGLTPRARRHGFDAFFSEKPAGRQRGLGLTRARRMVESLGGTVTIENAPSGGAVGIISVPRVVPVDRRRANPLAPDPEP